MHDRESPELCIGITRRAMVKPSSFSELSKIYFSYESRIERSSIKVKLHERSVVQLN